MAESGVDALSEGLQRVIAPAVRECDAALGHGGDRVSARGLCKRKPGTTEGHEIFWQDDWMEGH